MHVIKLVKDVFFSLVKLSGIRYKYIHQVFLKTLGLMRFLSHSAEILQVDLLE